MLRPLIAILSLLIATVAGGSEEAEISLQADEDQLIDEIASIIAEDAVEAWKGVKSDEEMGWVSREAARLTLNKVEPRLQRLARIVADPRHATKNIVQKIQRSALLKAARTNYPGAEGEFRTRSTSADVMGAVKFTKTFATSVFNVLQ